MFDRLTEKNEVPWLVPVKRDRFACQLAIRSRRQHVNCHQKVNGFSLFLAVSLSLFHGQCYF